MTERTRLPSTQPLVLAIDVGSTSVRARLFDKTATPVPGAEFESHRTPAPDGVEDPMALMAATEHAIDGALEAAGNDANRIAAVGMATFVGNVLGVDENGHAATPLYTYAHSEPYEEVEALRHALDVDATYEATGCPFHTSYQAPRLLWLQRHHPDWVAKATRWVDFGTFAYSRWTGRDDVPVSYSVASWTGMLDRNRLTWHQPVLDALKLPEERLPKTADYDEPVRGLNRSFAYRWPALANIPFFLAVGDGAGANIGSGCGEHGALALTVGTTGAMRGVIATGLERVPRGLWLYRINRELALLGGAITDGGSLLEWVHKTLRLDGEHLQDADVAKVAADSHGLTVLPFLRGERSPGWAVDARATWHGIRASTTPAELARAALEAMTYRFLLISQLLDRSGHEFKEVIAGGAAILHLPTWMQMMADALGKPVVASPDRGTTSRGVAILSLKALGVIESLTDISAARGRRYEPDPELRQVYAAGLDRQERIYRILVK